MRKLGKKQLTLQLQNPLDALPDALASYPLALANDGSELTFTYDTQGERTGITALIGDLGKAGIRFKDLQTRESSLEDIFVSLVEAAHMNLHAVQAIYVFEMARTLRTLLQSIVSPVISTSLYFVVFGAAIGSRITDSRGRQLRRLHRARPDHADVADAEHRQCLVRHLLPEIHRHDLRAPVGAGLLFRDRARLCRRGRHQIDLPRADHPGHRSLFVPLHIEHPLWMVLFLMLTAVTFSLFGFIIGIWADGFEKLQLVPLLIVTPLTFLGGSFYSIDMLPPFWQTVTLFNPVVYLVSGFRWSFFGTADVEHRDQPRHDAVFPGRSAWPSSPGYSGPATG